MNEFPLSIIQPDESTLPRSVEVALREISDLQPLLSRGEILVCARSYWEIHDIKTAEKTVLYRARWKPTNKLFSLQPPNHKLTVKNLEKKEVLIMTRHLEGVGTLGLWTSQEMILTVVPDIHVGRITTSHEDVFQVMDDSELQIFNVEKLDNCLPKRAVFTIQAPDGTEVGTIEQGNGGKHKIIVPTDLPIHHKVLLLGLTLNIQDDYDEDYDNEV